MLQICDPLLRSIYDLQLLKFVITCTAHRALDKRYTNAYYIIRILLLIIIIIVRLWWKKKRVNLVRNVLIACYSCGFW